MKRIYVKPESEIIGLNIDYEFCAGSTKWNEVGNFGPGDKDDDDREGDDNWDDDWSWTHN